jgi:hypothetical protein
LRPQLKGGRDERGRPQAMAYRDAHAADMSEADWSFIADRLELAYGLLKKALSPPIHG